MIRLMIRQSILAARRQRRLVTSPSVLSVLSFRVTAPKISGLIVQTLSLSFRFLCCHCKRRINESEMQAS